MAQPGQVEFVLRVIAADALGGQRRKNAIGADDAAAGVVAHHQVLAIGIVDVVVDTGRTAVQTGAEFVGEDAIAQLLCRQDVVLAAGEGDTQLARAAFARLGLDLQHGSAPMVVCAANLRARLFSAVKAA